VNYKTRKIISLLIPIIVLCGVVAIVGMTLYRLLQPLF
jgi:hypothetical protein